MYVKLCRPSSIIFFRWELDCLSMHYTERDRGKEGGREVCMLACYEGKDYFSFVMDVCAYML